MLRCLYTKVSETFHQNLQILVDYKALLLLFQIQWRKQDVISDVDCENVNSDWLRINTEAGCCD
jgi:hypothetical protein